MPGVPERKSSSMRQIRSLEGHVSQWCSKQTNNQHKKLMARHQSQSSHARVLLMKCAVKQFCGCSEHGFGGWKLIKLEAAAEFVINSLPVWTWATWSRVSSSAAWGLRLRFQTSMASTS